MDSLEKQILIFIRPPLAVSKKILKLHRLLASKFHNEYMNHATFEWESHLMVYLSPMPISKTKDIVEITSEVVKKFQPFIIKLGNFAEIPGNFIAIKIEGTSFNTLEKIHLDLVQELVHLRGKGIKPKYLERWDTFDKEEKQRIKQTGLPYKYLPHLTLARLPSEEIPKALKFIEKLNFLGKPFQARGLMVAQESDSPLVDWNIIGDFKFKE